MKSYYFKLLKLGLISDNFNRRNRNIVTTVIHRAKRNYFLNCFNTCRDNVNKTWNIISRILTSNTTRDSVRTVVVDGLSVSDGADLADEFNKYFSSIAKKFDDEIPYTQNSPINYLSLVDRPNSLFLTPVTTVGCASVIQKLKLTSYDAASLPVPILKKSFDYLIIPLTALINKSFLTGVFPEHLP